MLSKLKQQKASINDGNVPMSFMDYSFVLGCLIVTILLGIIFVGFQTGVVKSLAILWSLACFACGAIIGFLFGIPRVLQGDVVRPPAQQTGSEKDETSLNQQTAYQQQVNTNLEQISDWLTKIIVGIGLIELRRLPELLNRSSAFIARGLGEATASQAVVSSNQTLAAAIIIYFGLIGFLNGYMITRIYLAGAFKRADTGVDSILDVGGNKLNIGEAAEQQGNLIRDLLGRVSALQSHPTADATKSITGGDEASAVKRSTVHSILWVDDNPKNNSYIIESLGERGITVTTSLSTTDAVSKLSHQKFDRIITDMGRREGAAYNETAGIDLIQKMRDTDHDTPIIVYCSPQAVAKYRNAAIAAGANDITPSPSLLLSALRLDE